ncbi:MAG: hypothetical protein IJS29_01870 [Selenomonadaceae bacterium]|nr:hypothetical protein [Selenomonadaceae bacterium]
MKNVVPTKKFTDDVKFYIRKKNYKNIKYDIKEVTDELTEGNLVGDRLEGLDIPEGTAAYKVRIANSSANVGKSGGFRLLYYVAIGDDIYLLSIYSKKDDIRILNDKQIEILIKNILNDENLDESFT